MCDFDSTPRPCLGQKICDGKLELKLVKLCEIDISDSAVSAC